MTSRWVCVMSLTLLLGACKLEIQPATGGQARPSAKATGTCTPATSGAYCGDFGTSVTLEVIPEPQPGYEFTGWAGDCQGMGICTLTMSAHHTVKAQFTPVAELALHDTTTDVNELMEQGRLQGACDRYMRAPEAASDYLTNMCGKWMFFYEGFGITGVPKPIVTFMIDNLPNTVGKGFEKFGMVADPTSPEHLPLGFGPGAKMNGVDTMSYTCASCHFGKTPDGRFAVGLSNHDYDYGRQLIAMMMTPLAAALPSQTELSPTAKAAIQPHLDELKANAAYPELLQTLLKLTPVLTGGGSVPTIDPALQDQYLSWKPGTQDFIIAPVGMDDHAHTVSKIMPLWNLYTVQEMEAKGGHGAMLGFTGSTTSYDVFLQGFVALSVGNGGAYTAERMRPLKTYILSLKAAKAVQPQDPLLVAAGQRIFDAQGCASCHNGPSHAGTRIFSFEEIGTDAALKRWGDPDLTCKTNVPAVITEPLTHGLKAPRLVGLWAQKRFLHNGSVDSLEDLLCLNKARPTRMEEPHGDQGHLYGCGELSGEDKKALVAFLKAL
ncbi:MAG: hypothetical protein QM742_11105 [Aquabacterium sp.]